MVVCSMRIGLALCCKRILYTFDLQLKSQRIIIGGVPFPIRADYRLDRNRNSQRVVCTLLPPKVARICFDRNQSQPVRKNFILND